jgi:hypothetical protein
MFHPFFFFLEKNLKKLKKSIKKAKRSFTMVVGGCGWASSVCKKRQKI